MLIRWMMAAALVVPMFAFDDDRWDRRDRDRWERDGPYNVNGRYGNPGVYGYRGNRNYSAVLNRTMQDLRSAAARNRVNSHERGHFNRAMSELQNMRYGSGNVDSRRLSRVIEDLDHLSRAAQVHPRDRQILARDRQELASLFSGYGYNRW